MKIRMANSTASVLLRGIVLAGVLAAGLAGCASNGDFKKSPREAAGYNAQLGIEYMKSGNLQAAREKIDRALKQDPQSPDVQYNAGLLYQRLGEVEKADHHYQTALKLKPDDPERQNTYGGFLCGQKRVAEGEKLLLKAARNPAYRTPALAYRNLGICLQDAGRIEEARGYLEKAYALEPRLRPQR